MRCHCNKTIVKTFLFWTKRNYCPYRTIANEYYDAPYTGWKWHEYSLKTTYFKIDCLVELEKMKRIRPKGLYLSVLVANTFKNVVYSPHLSFRYTKTTVTVYLFFVLLFCLLGTWIRVVSPIRYADLFQTKPYTTSFSPH